MRTVILSLIVALMCTSVASATGRRGFVQRQRIVVPRQQVVVQHQVFVPQHQVFVPRQQIIVPNCLPQPQGFFFFGP